RDLATARAGLLAELTALLGDAAFDGRGGGRARGLARLAPLDRAAADHYVRIAAAHGRVATLVRQLASAHAEALRLLGPESGRAAEEQLRALAADCAALGRIVRGRAAFLPDSLDPALDRLAELQRAITAALGGVAVDTLHTDAADRQARELLRARVAQARRLEAAGAAIRTALPFLRVLALAGGAAATYLVARRRLAQLRRQVEEITPAALLARGLALRRPRADGRGLRTEGRETRAPLHRLRALAAPLARATRDAERAWRKVKSA
ncbi:MAG TPA: hypothetical protein VNL77_15760, partial [Roseiflexaceae bacterium]|nr:hypothetical protein [Roseiflexaceae bacterium]